MFAQRPLLKTETQHSPKALCGSFLQVFDELTAEPKNLVVRCSKPECKGHKWRRVVYRCHRRDHADYGIIEKAKNKRIVILENSCTKTRYARARFRIEQIFRDYSTIRYAVFTQRPVRLNTRQDLVDNVEDLIKALSKWKGNKIQGCVIVVDPIKKSDGSYHLHYNVAWVGDFILKSELEKRWGKGFVKVYRRQGKRAKEFTIHYLAIRTAIMNEPTFSQRVEIFNEEFTNIFKGFKFLRVRFWSREEHRETNAWIKAWLDFYSHNCKICWSKLEVKRVEPEGVQSAVLKFLKPPD